MNYYDKLEEIADNVFVPIRDKWVKLVKNYDYYPYKYCTDYDGVDIYLKMPIQINPGFDCDIYSIEEYKTYVIMAIQYYDGTIENIKLKKYKGEDINGRK